MENNNRPFRFGGVVIGLAAAAGYAAYTYVKNKAKKEQVIDISSEATDVEASTEE